MTDMGNHLREDRVSYLKQVLESFGHTQKQLEEDVGILTKWLKTQKHLPEIPSKNHIINYLLINKFSIEKCKQRLDMYYTIRTLLPEMYSDMDYKNTLKQANTMYSLLLPKRTSDGGLVNIFKIMETNSNNFDLNSVMGYCYNTVDVWLNEDVITSFIVLCDMEKVRMGHIQKITLIHLKKMIMIAEKVYGNRAKQFHLVNCPSYAYNLLTLAKTFLKPKLASRIIIHEDSSKIGEILPLEILPKDYGGSELSLYELNELWKKKLVEYGDRFDVLAKMKTNEELRISPLVNNEVLGFHGNFRKLDTD